MSVTQIEEEHIVDLIDHLVGSELTANGLQMFSHGSKRNHQEELRRLPQTDKLAYPPQRPASQPRPQPAVLGGTGSEADDHGFGLLLPGPELRDRVKIISIEPQLVAATPLPLTPIFRPA